MSKPYYDQAIFDAIVAATSSSEFLMMGTITIDVQKFIDTFNNHRDRALCTSLNVTRQPLTAQEHASLPQRQDYAMPAQARYHEELQKQQPKDEE